jgi:hypothetical protein
MIFIEILSLLECSLYVIEVKVSEIVQFCDPKTNLHIRVHAFPCSKFFAPIFIEILSIVILNRRAVLM